MSKSNYLENAVLDFWLNANGGGFSAPATVYLGLIETADPTDSTINEIASTSYTATGASANQRPPITFATTTGSSFAGPSSDIEFENTSGSAFVVKGFGIFKRQNAIALAVNEQSRWQAGFDVRHRR